ncbi:MAG: nickel-responsive transcriptional regulator NikR [Phycisphaerae bacterium]|jgi:CopG family nickel-responsive transcriptional regulator
MSYVDRFSVSLDTELLAAFDRHIADRGYSNRSEAIRDMIRELLVNTRLKRGDQPTLGILVAVHDPADTEVAKRLHRSLAAADDVYCGSFRISAGADGEASAIALRGPAEQVQRVANEIQALRGLKHVSLSAIPLECDPNPNEPADQV